MRGPGNVPGESSLEGDPLASGGIVGSSVKPFAYFTIVASIVPSIPSFLCDMPMYDLSQ